MRGQVPAKLMLYAFHGRLSGIALFSKKNCTMDSPPIACGPSPPSWQAGVNVMDFSGWPNR
ncbi:hypothetical protein SAMN05443635_10229 [Roseobacter denitrificans OCh 114]|nr:hypothetical protein SAMN05443635_10229 [Roseobacter denitrificans OCh 114]